MIKPKDPSINYSESISVSDDKPKDVIHIKRKQPAAFSKVTLPNPLQMMQVSSLANDYVKEEKPAPNFAFIAKLGNSEERNKYVESYKPKSENFQQDLKKDHNEQVKRIKYSENTLFKDNYTTNGLKIINEYGKNKRRKSL